MATRPTAISTISLTASTLNPTNNGLVGYAASNMEGTPGILYMTAASVGHGVPESNGGFATPMFPSCPTARVMSCLTSWDVNNNNQFDFGVDTFCKPTSFQIISAGQDGSFGTTFTATHGHHAGQALSRRAEYQPDGIRGPARRHSGISYDPPPPNGGSADDDNVTNFCEKHNLEVPSRKVASDTQREQAVNLLCKPFSSRHFRCAL